MSIQQITLADKCDLVVTKYENTESYLNDHPLEKGARTRLKNNSITVGNKLETKLFTSTSIIKKIDTLNINRLAIFTSDSIYTIRIIG